MGTFELLDGMPKLLIGQLASVYRLMFAEKVLTDEVREVRVVRD